MSESKNVLKNVIVSIFSQVIILILGLIVPRIILVNYGSDINGFTSTITQIFTYMALLEAGVSQSARNLLYKPIKENNQIEVSYYISAARNNYRRISRIYFIAVVACSMVMPVVLKTDIDAPTVIFYVFFEGLSGAVSFYFVEAWRCLLTVDGRYFVINIVTVVSKIFMYGAKIVLAILGVNILFIQISYFLVSVMGVFIYFWYVKKNYPWIDYTSAPKDVKLKDRNAFIITELAWTIFSSTDMIVLSIFVSTSMSSVYSVYNMVYVALNGIVNTVYTSVNYRLGQTFGSNIAEYIRLHDLFNSIFVGGMTVLMCTTYILIPYFVSIYTHGVTDINYSYFWLPLLFCLVQLFSWSRSIAGNLISVAGRIKQAVWISVVEAGVNLTLSLILVQYMGITGVVLATVVALPLKIVYNNYVGDRIILQRNPVKTAKILCANFALFISIAFCSNHYLNLDITTYYQFFIYAVPIFLVILLLGLVINTIVNRDLLRLKQVYPK